MKIKRSLAALSLPLALIAAGCSDDETADETTTTAAEVADETTTTAAEDSGDDMAAEENIVGVASGNPDFSTLVDLVGKAGLVEALSGEGPFTVFAPTNDAFAKVDAATLDTLAADPTGALADVLKLHVVSGKIMAADIPAEGTTVETLAGGKLKVEVMDGEVMVGGAKVVATDVAASNGVIHVIDSVITQPNG